MIQRVEQLLRQIVISTNSTKREMKPLQLPSYQYQQEAKELQPKLQLQSSGNSVSSIDAQLGDARADAAAQLSKLKVSWMHDGSQYLRGNCGRSQP